MKKSRHAVILGRAGGKARAKSLSAERRKAIAKHAAMMRWHPEQVARELAQQIREGT